jgi:methyltransferase (TIGR00027 family)
VLPPVSATAVGVAAIRAAESARPDRLFDDPLAAAFVREAAFAPRRMPGDRTAGLVAWITTRTRFLDDLILDACAAGCRQVVILGAGLDARAFRLQLPSGTRCFEVDLPDVLGFKERVIAEERSSPTCERRVVPTDLAADWTEPLRAAGFEAEESVVWLAEGLLVYLSPEANDSLLDQVTALSVGGSRFGITVRTGPAEAARLADPEDYVSLWRSSGQANPMAWLGGRGWEAQVFAPEERAAAYGRPAQGASWRAKLVDAVKT